MVPYRAPLLAVALAGALVLPIAPGSAGQAFTPPGPADFSARGWTAAFDAMSAKLRAEYAFTRRKDIDWPVLVRRYHRRVAAAEAAGSRLDYYRALRQFAHEFHDGHVSLVMSGDPFAGNDDALERRVIGGGFGLVLTRLADGRVIASWVQPGGSADRSGIAAGATVMRWRGQPIGRALRSTSTVWGPSQATKARTRVEQLRYLVRAPIGAQRRLVFRNPAGHSRRALLRAGDDHLLTLRMTDTRSVLRNGLPRRMLSARILPGDIGYLRIRAEIDLPPFSPGDHTPTMQLFADALRAFKAAAVAGVVVDIRQNGGGLDDMAAAMLGSFTGRRTFYEYANFRVPGTNRFEVWKYDDATGTYPWPGRGTTVVPTPPRYRGPVVALIDNGCISSCEGLAMGIQRLPQGRTVGAMGTNGSFGMAGGEAAMPGGYSIHWPYGQSLDRRHRIQIDSRNGVGGVHPDVGIPMSAGRAVRWWQGHDIGLSAALRALRPAPAQHRRGPGGG